jgi:hypothetical protein
MEVFQLQVAEEWHDFIWTTDTKDRALLDPLVRLPCVDSQAASSLF